MLTEKALKESKLTLSAHDVVEAELLIMELLNFKIPNFSLRHFLEAQLTVGFSTEDDYVCTFPTEEHKSLIYAKMKESD